MLEQNYSSAQNIYVQLKFRWSSARARQSHGSPRRAYDPSVKRINCVCGIVIEAEDDDDFCEKVEEHLRIDHPELVGKVSPDDILAQAEEI